MIHRTGAFFAAFVFFTLSAAWASNPLEQRLSSEKTEGLLNKLLAPGPMIEGHRNLETAQCLKCHVPRKGVPDSKCLDCHKEVREQVERKTGFHGLAKKTCIQCHGEHKGRAHDTTLIDENKFNHALTGYELVGKHARLKCVECHTEKRSQANEKKLRLGEPRFMGLKVSCVSCHKKHDVHKFQDPFALKDCSSCHGVKSWKTDIRFDHEKDGRFRLDGKHARSKCAKCHRPKEGQVIYKWPELARKKCQSCHEDTHGQRLSERFRGGECSKCHGEEAWKIEKFDHGVTSYPLKGEHASTDCLKCHKQPQAILRQGSAGKKEFQWAGLKQGCLSCHKDFHFFGEFRSPRTKTPNACLNCHTETNWKEIRDFRHEVNTRYPLEGKHKKLACAKCHKTSSPPNQSSRYEFTELAEKNCATCHKNVHEKVFSAKASEIKCSDCHIVKDWKLFDRHRARFVHDEKATRFQIDGKHSELECSKCHIRGKKQMFQFASDKKGFCGDCHKNVHLKQFTPASRERSCGDCHLTASFKKLRKFDHDRTSLPLRGKHAAARCEKCHMPGSEFLESKPPRPARRFVFAEIAERNCAACHKDPHKGSFGPSCAECHGDDTWKKQRDFHRGFSLSGVHYSLKCSECHQGGKRLGGMSENCLLCHQKDDVHHGGLPNCGECHRQQFWESTEFKHSMTRFPLRGIHRTLDCYSCHRGGVYQGTPDRCVDCHLQDALSAASPPHNPLLVQRNCAECHNQFTFR